RAAADDGDRLAARRRDLGNADLAGLALVVGDEALQVSDGDGVGALGHETIAFALLFLRTDPSGDGRKGVVFANLGRGAEVVAGEDQRDEVLDLDGDRTARGAGRLGAHQAADRLHLGQLRIETEVHFLEVARPHG